MKRKTGKDRLRKYAMGSIVGDDPNDPNPSKKKYTSQQQINKDNAEAKRFAMARGLFSGEETVVARNIGDPVVQYIDAATGKPYVPTPTKKLANKVPLSIGPNDIKSSGNIFWYDDPTTGDVIDIDPALILNTPRFRKSKETIAADYGARQNSIAKATFAGGGEATSSSQWMGLAQMVPGIADGIIDLLENNPKAYSKQPTLNATTMKNMVTPYAMGGEASIEDMGLDEEQLTQLQAMADQQGISIEELIQMLQGGQIEEDTDTENEMATEEMDAEQEFAYGGRSGRRRIPIEVEGKETLQTPDGTVSRVKGPSHENGGVDLVVPDGTEIYSKRIKIDNRTMAERKVARERTLARLQKLIEKNPMDKLLRSTCQRSVETIGIEDAKDMQIQKIATQNIAPPEPEFAYGGKVGKKYAYGDVASNEDPIFPYNMNYLELGQNFFPDANDISAAPNKAYIDKLAANKFRELNPPRKGAVSTSSVNKAGKLTLGDYIGLAGTTFNAVAPLLNTEAARRNSKPNVNRFLGFGKDAIDANNVAQDTASNLRTSSLTDIDSNTNAARSRTRNSVRSVNSLRAFDAITDMGAGKAKVAANDAFAKQMINLLGQRGQLENTQDAMVMKGETSRDIENKADLDNYYTNKAQNLVNLGTNVQGIGRAINQSKSNRVDSKLLGQLSQYGLEFDDEGNLISVR